jgi:U3 small nucleolar RNA-associated protein 15
MRNLKRMVAEEIQIQHMLQGIQGMISPMLALATR